MGLFGNLFGSSIQQPITVGSDAQPLTVEFTEMAVELIDDFVSEPNAVWVSIANGVVLDPEQPWKTQQSEAIKNAVKIVFLQDTLEDRQLLRYMKGAVANTGNVNGIMYRYGFEPKIKDIVKWQGRELKVNAVDPIAPIDEAIIYILEFAS